MTQKESLLRRLNEAFARNDADFILESVTDSIRWTIIGDRTIEGKSDLASALREMAGDREHKLTIDRIVSNGDFAAVNGTMHSNGESGESTVAFCDVYSFIGATRPKINEITSYAIAIKEGA